MTSAITERSRKIWNEIRKSNPDIYLVKECLAQGDIDFNVDVTPDRDSMLIWAIWQKHIEIVKLLVEAGAPVNVTLTRKKPHAPLFWAIGANSLPMVKILVAHGADIHQENAEKNTALLYALYNSNTDKEIIFHLLAHGAKTDVENVIHETPFILAEKKHGEDVQSMIKTFSTAKGHEQARIAYFNESIALKEPLARKRVRLKKPSNGFTP